MPLLANALITTKRSSYVSATGVTTAEANVGVYLAAVPAAVWPDEEANFLTRAPGSLVTYWIASIDSGTDIQASDLISSITLLDGVTPFPNDFPTTAQITWRIEMAYEEPGPLPDRQLRLVRQIASSR